MPVAVASSTSPIIVTNHALIRYLTRVKRFDDYQATRELKYNRDKIVREMVPHSTMKRMEKFGDGNYSVGDYKLVVSNGAVVTTLYGVEQDFVEAKLVRGMKRGFAIGVRLRRNHRKSEKGDWDA